MRISDNLNFVTGGSLPLTASEKAAKRSCDSLTLHFRILFSRNDYAERGAKRFVLLLFSRGNKFRSAHR